MKTFIVKTLGCKVNQFESEALCRSLQACGCKPGQDNAPADLCIINTCTVTQKAAMQSRQAIRQAIRANPSARVVVTGCYAQTQPDAIQEIPGVSEVVGHADKHKIAERFQPAQTSRESGSEWRPAVFSRTAVPEGAATPSNRTRPFLKIQDGCNAFCTYCIVPYARGRSRSMPSELVLENIRNLKKAGYREVVLTGIHLGCYGLDLNPRTDLAALLKRVLNSTPVERLRLSSIEPRELSDDLISLAAASDKVCRHFHIPLQSGDDGILKKMRRPYSTDFFKEIVLKIHHSIPDAAIGLDTLIGFPGETERAFENTLVLVKELPIAYLHVFPFSARMGTPAYEFTDRLSARVIKARCRKIRELGVLKKRAFYESMVGSRTEVLVESKRDAASGFLKGITSNYMPVLFSGGDALKNSLVKVSIDKISDHNLACGSLIATALTHFSG